jgi:hypothetical protein
MAYPNESYKSIDIQVGFGVFPSIITKQPNAIVQTENNATSLNITFPLDYYPDSDYAKFVDVLYTGSDNLTYMETYAIGTALIAYDVGTVTTTTEIHLFNITGDMTYGLEIMMQFRMLYAWSDFNAPPQEIVDPVIFAFKLKAALNPSGFMGYEIQPAVSGGALSYSGYSGYSGCSGYSGYSGMSGDSGISGYT